MENQQGISRKSCVRKVLLYCLLLWGVLGVLVLPPAKRMGEIWGGSREEEQGGNHCFHRAPVVLKNVAI